MTACPDCGQTVDKDRLLEERVCPHCQTHLEDLYRLAAGLPVRRDQWRFLDGGQS
ncbi:hypothetical protein [Halorussus salinus]|uniref:hypothetical protein n=1 Tax=Halorussus salinus TaxID=1364935 RepID=UPI00138F6920|nr:hypothetical protein [Halorussus salinus]